MHTQNEFLLKKRQKPNYYHIALQHNLTTDLKTFLEREVLLSHFTVAQKAKGLKGHTKGWHFVPKKKSSIVHQTGSYLRGRTKKRARRASPVPALRKLPRHLPLPKHRTGEARGTFYRELKEPNTPQRPESPERADALLRLRRSYVTAEPGAAAAQHHCTKADGTSSTAHGTGWVDKLSRSSLEQFCTSGCNS